MRQKQFMIAALCVLATNTYAIKPPKPNKCPAPAVIAQTGLDSKFVILGPNQKWMVGYTFSHYDTPNFTWSFLLSDIMADNASEAYQKGVNSLGSLIPTSDLEYNKQVNKWICFYKTAQEYRAETISPSLEGRQREKII